MLRTYRYRLYPTAAQEQAMREILQAACWLYNAALHYRRKRRQESRHSVSYHQQAAMWREWRNEEAEDNPLRLLNMTAGQQILRRLDSAFKEFFKKKRGYPRFKQPRSFNSVAYKPGDGADIKGGGADIKGGKLYLQNVGRLTTVRHRPVPDGRLKNIILLRKASGWYVCFQVKLPKPEPRPHTGPGVGVDMGIYHALALSDGTIVDSPRYLQQSLARLRRLQRKAARQKRGSNRQRRTYRQIARLNEHIANQRRDWWHKVTRQLVDTYSTIVLEALNLKFMLEGGNLSRAAHDVGLGMFRELLGYKAMEAGVGIIMVDPAYTTQECSGCHRLVPKDLSVRVHHCPDCGLIVDRDVNAAGNVYSAGMRRSGANVAGCGERSLRSSPL